MRGGGRKNLRGTFTQSVTTGAAGTRSSAGSTPLDGVALIQRGNEYFFSDCYLEATGYYYQAAMLLKTKDHQTERSKAWSNVAECHLRLQNWHAAEDASTNALVADPTNHKAFYRRAKARFELGDYSGAAKDADQVGTYESRDVAALCRELAHAEVARNLTNNTGATRGIRRDGGRRKQDRAPSKERRARQAVLHSAPATARPQSTKYWEQRELWFRKIIDSYRLRVDDEYAQTGASDAGCLYGIRAKGGFESPLEHFRAYVQRAVKKRVLPEWFTLGDMDDIVQMATTDNFSNINVAVVPENILDFYSRFTAIHNEVHELRNLAMYIEGPIGMPWTEGPGGRDGGIKALKKTSKTNLPNQRPEPHYGIPPMMENKYDLGRTLLGKQGSARVIPSPSRTPGTGTQYSGIGARGQLSIPQQNAQQQRADKREVRTPSPRQKRSYSAPRGQRMKPQQTPTSPKKQEHNAANIPYQSETRRERYPQALTNRPSTPTRRGRSFSPKREKRVRALAQSPGWVPPTPSMSHPYPQYQAVTSPTYDNALSNEPRSPSPIPISDESESAPSEPDSFGPQLPYQTSMLSQLQVISPMRPVGSDLRHGQHPFYGLYDQEETSSAQEVRNGFLRDVRDEFSELTEVSP